LIRRENALKCTLIPVKDLSHAKQRLAGLLSPEERTSLAWLLMKHVFNEVAAVKSCDTIAIVTAYEPAMRLGRRLGFEIISETEQISESISVDYGSRIARDRGATSVLRLPIDLPIIVASDIEMLLQHAGRDSDVPASLLVPSRDGTGTNALLRTPPDLFPSHFGPNSLEKHCAESLCRGARCDLLHLPRVACDLDEPADIAYLIGQGKGTKTYEYLMDLGIDRRLNCKDPA